MLHHAYDVAKNMCWPIRTLICRSTNWLINYMYNKNFALVIYVHLHSTYLFLGYYKSYYAYGKLYRKKICPKVCKKIKKLRRVCSRRCRRVKQKLCRLVSKKRICRSYPYCYNKPYCKFFSIKSMWKWLWLANTNDTVEIRSDSLRFQIWFTSLSVHYQFFGSALMNLQK